MRRLLLNSVVLVAAAGTAARAQNPYQAPPAGAKHADIAGTWDGKTMVGPKDSVITTWTLVIDPGKSWTLTLPGRPPVAGGSPSNGRGSARSPGGGPVPPRRPRHS